ncbi:uncharacterized protein NECHADRAFT_87019 [Fusarium vanettenii 77-13-4]|uniref:NYN domain-containing protein n=1 Tax=Fusarium vanettenii (strain ATCC MYA-4622 / CBS 123669 / FGSC 9596 / NRRL 45880 / 77-13-4) TaxID=660122 RepID=C7ZMP4_FUSV7|nr:uncharacterized protein NECHADRAFT_87019 [Fusarium vanettenii 77-13-4]EEU34708.1 hypothetical protein NECHADRAFT_87019 [Fusarium vanettenii 77-13-4]
MQTCGCGKEKTDTTGSLLSLLIALVFLVTRNDNETQLRFISLKLLHLHDILTLYNNPSNASLIPMQSRISTRAATPRRVEQIRIYIDNSNVWIQGQRTSAEKRGLPEKLDPTWRFDAGKLKNVLTQNCGLPADEDVQAIVDLYGSTPHEIDATWRAIESCDVRVHTFERSSWTKREKKSTLKSSRPRTFIIVSGDKDLIRAVLRIAKREFQVHVWSWRNGISAAYTQPKEECRHLMMDRELIEVHFLDDFMDKFSFHEEVFDPKKSAIPDNSIVILEPSINRDIINQVLENLRISYRLHHLQRRGVSEKDLVIILICELDHETHTEIFQDMREELKRYNLRAMTYFEYNNSASRPQNPKGKFITPNPFDPLRKANGIDSKSGQDNDGFTPVNNGRKKQNKRLKAEQKLVYNRCVWRLYCSEGTRCKYGHTIEETATFEACGTRKAKRYKFCSNGKDCFKKTCNYAHKWDELLCPTCDKTGPT